MGLMWYSISVDGTRFVDLILALLCAVWFCKFYHFQLVFPLKWMVSVPFGKFHLTRKDWLRIFHIPIQIIQPCAIRKVRFINPKGSIYTYIYIIYIYYIYIYIDMYIYKFRYAFNRRIAGQQVACMFSANLSAARRYHFAKPWSWCQVHTAPCCWDMLCRFRCIFMCGHASHQASADINFAQVYVYIQVCLTIFCLVHWTPSWIQFFHVHCAFSNVRRAAKQHITAAW